MARTPRLDKVFADMNVVKRELNDRGIKFTQESGKRISVPCPFHGGEKNSYKIMVADRINTASGYCYSECNKSYGFYSYLAKVSGKSQGEIIKELAYKYGCLEEIGKMDLSKEYATIEEILFKMHMLSWVKNENISKDFRYVDIVIKRKIPKAVIQQYKPILGNIELFKSTLTENERKTFMNWLVYTAKGSEYASKKLEILEFILFTNNSNVIIPIYNEKGKAKGLHIYNPNAGKSPTEEDKKIRYQSIIGNETYTPLGADTLSRNKDIIISEGLFGMLTPTRVKGFESSLATLGAHRDRGFETLVPLLEKYYSEENTIYLAFDENPAGEKSTNILLEKLRNLNIRRVKVFSRGYFTEDAVDDIMNNNNIENMEEIFYDSNAWHVYVHNFKGKCAELLGDKTQFDISTILIAKTAKLSTLSASIEVLYTDLAKLINIEFPVCDDKVILNCLRRTMYIGKSVNIKSLKETINALTDDVSIVEFVKLYSDITGSMHTLNDKEIEIYVRNLFEATDTESVSNLNITKDVVQTLNKMVNVFDVNEVRSILRYFETFNVDDSMSNKLPKGIMEYIAIFG